MRFAQYPVTFPAGAAQSATLDTAGWLLVAVELPQGFQGARLELLTGDLGQPPRRVFLFDQTSAVPCQLQLPAALAAGDVALQLDPGATRGRGCLAFRSVQSDGGTPQPQSTARTLTVALVREP
jgi:hypothetical protein